MSDVQNLLNASDTLERADGLLIDAARTEKQSREMIDSAMGWRAQAKELRIQARELIKSLDLLKAPPLAS